MNQEHTTDQKHPMNQELKEYQNQIKISNID